MAAAVNCPRMGACGQHRARRSRARNENERERSRDERPGETMDERMTDSAESRRRAIGVLGAAACIGIAVIVVALSFLF
jgi:hypothetical protein